MHFFEFAKYRIVIVDESYTHCCWGRPLQSHT
jgi:hypothetical protein